MLPGDTKKKDILTENKTRQILQVIHTPSELSQYCNLFDDCIDGLSVQHKVMLAIEQLASEHREVLLNCFIRFPNNIVKAAAACNMSRATFYRHHKKAIKKA